MPSPHKNPKRYQASKTVSQILKKQEPWIFRSHLSSAAEIFKDGDWLKLVDGDNKTIGYGIYEKEGLIAIRMISYGEKTPDKKFFDNLIQKALNRRKNLQNYASATRLIAGENDGFPGIVIDNYNGHWVLQTYSSTLDSFGRWLCKQIHAVLPAKSILWKLPTKRKDSKKETRQLYEHTFDLVHFNEGKMEYTVNLVQGQKSGTFLDLRGLRKWVSQDKLNGKRVLNLFSYTGTLGLAAETAGAKEIWNVDISEEALSFAKKNHTKDPKKHKFIKADIFEWLASLSENEKFDLIIVDPPNMGSDISQVKNTLRTYERMWRQSLTHLSQHGKIIVACCTSRVTRQEFSQQTKRVFSPHLKLIKDIQPEDDHPVNFSQGDYLKILVYG